MTLDTSEYRFLSGAFQKLYKDKEAQLRGNPPDMLSGLEMPPSWQDQDEVRFLPVDFRDFWLCQDARATMYFAGRRSATSYGESQYCTPKLQRQPQEDNYSGNAIPNGSPYAGHWVAYMNSAVDHMSFYYNLTDNPYQFLCCESDAPGVLSAVGDQLTYIGNSLGLQYTWTADAYAYSTFSADSVERGDVFVMDDRETGHPASAWYSLHSPCYTSALISALSANFGEGGKRVIQYATSQAVTMLPSQAVQQASAFNAGNPTPYMWFFMNDSEESCGTARNHRDYASSDYQVQWVDMTHWGRPSQQVNWRNERVKGSPYPYTYRQYIRDENTVGLPRQSPDAQAFRLYSQAPAFCYYGKPLSADVYLFWRISYTGDNGTYFYSRKISAEFERSDYYAGDVFTPYIGRYAMRSTRTWSFDELFTLWKPFSLSQIPSAVNNARQLAGLSAWAFPPGGTFPGNEYSDWPAHSFSVYFEQPFVVWRFSHPLLEDRDHHFPNQDPPA